MKWYDLIWYDLIWYDMTWYAIDMILYDIILYDMILYDMILYDMTWHDTIYIVWFVVPVTVSRSILDSQIGFPLSLTSSSASSSDLSRISAAALYSN